MAEPIDQATLVILTIAAIVFLIQAIRQKRANQLSPASFSTVLLIVIVGWIVTEVISDATGTEFGLPMGVAHFGVMILVAVAVTLQLKRAYDFKK